MDSVFAGHGEEPIGGDNRARESACEREKVMVARDQKVGLAGDGELQERHVERIAASRGLRCRGRQRASCQAWRIARRALAPLANVTAYPLLIAYFRVVILIMPLNCFVAYI